VKWLLIAIAGLEHLLEDRAINAALAQHLLKVLVPLRILQKLLSHDQADLVH